MNRKREGQASRGKAQPCEELRNTSRGRVRPEHLRLQRTDACSFATIIEAVPVHQQRVKCGSDDPTTATATMCYVLPLPPPATATHTDGHRQVHTGLQRRRRRDREKDRERARESKQKKRGPCNLMQEPITLAITHVLTSPTEKLVACAKRRHASDCLPPECCRA